VSLYLIKKGGLDSMNNKQMHDKLMSIETGIDENDFKEGVKNGYTID